MTAQGQSTGQGTLATDVVTDVVILGGGPAGAVAALNLAPFLRVCVIDKAPRPASRIGESLPAAAGPLLRDMGLLDAFQAQGHLPCRFMRSTWGEAQTAEQDAMRNLDGHGWYLDRQRFDGWLQAEAERRGAYLLRGAQLVDCSRAGADWLLQVEQAGKRLPLRARFLIDASGRHARLTRMLGARRKVLDKLVCGWLSGTEENAGDDGGSGELHAEAGGWWYSSPLPHGRRVLAFFTDADLDHAGDAQDATRLLARLENIGPLSQTLRAQGFRPEPGSGYCAAHSAVSDRVSGDGWLAVGDAALALDPLSSQGMFNALYTGLAGATALHASLREGDAEALPQYQDAIDRIQSAYQSHRQAWYGEERRWPQSSFWRRRQAG